MKTLIGFAAALGLVLARSPAFAAQDCSKSQEAKASDYCTDQGNTYLKGSCQVNSTGGVTTKCIQGIWPRPGETQPTIIGPYNVNRKAKKKIRTKARKSLP